MNALLNLARMERCASMASTSTLVTASPVGKARTVIKKSTSADPSLVKTAGRAQIYSTTTSARASLDMKGGIALNGSTGANLLLARMVLLVETN
jgi:predicted deacylase